MLVGVLGTVGTGVMTSGLVPAHPGAGPHARTERPPVVSETDRCFDVEKLDAAPLIR
jgi:hypothetical protein